MTVVLVGLEFFVVGIEVVAGGRNETVLDRPGPHNKLVEGYVSG